MCSAKSKLQQQQQRTNSKEKVVLGPNRTPLLERCNSMPLINNSTSPTVSIPVPSLFLSKSKSFNYTTTSPAGSLAAARREQVATLYEQRKLRTAHYGRKLLPPPHHSNSHQEKRCSFITPNSDPIYVAYHDQEWGVPVHDDRMLFEVLVLTGAQVGSEWSSVLRRRQDFREAFSGFDAEIVWKYSEKKINSIAGAYGIEVSLVRGVVDNSKRILQVKEEFGSLDKYVWGFVNHKAMWTQYKLCSKIPAKTSKSEAISKDMVRTEEGIPAGGPHRYTLLHAGRRPHQRPLAHLSPTLSTPITAFRDRSLVY